MAEKINKIATWVAENFFLAAGILFLIVYLRWFQLTPLMLNGHNDSDGALVFGFIALALYVVSIILLKFLKRFTAGKIFLSGLSLLLLYTNFIHSTRYFPLLENNVNCEHARYYITWGHPFGDYQWTNYTLTKWENIFTYETRFFGYTPSAGPFEIVCDNDREEANILKIYPEFKILDHTDGQRPRNYNHYTSAEMNGKLYFLSEECDGWISSTCESMTYTLFSCNQEYKSCSKLPIQYTDPDDEIYELNTNELTGEVVLYLYDDYNEDDIIVFTYGEDPHCYVEGCEILQENNP